MGLNGLINATRKASESTGTNKWYTNPVKPDNKEEIVEEIKRMLDVVYTKLLPIPEFKDICNKYILEISSLTRHQLEIAYDYLYFYLNLEKDERKLYDLAITDDKYLLVQPKCITNPVYKISNNLHTCYRYFKKQSIYPNWATELSSSVFDLADSDLQGKDCAYMFEDVSNPGLKLDLSNVKVNHETSVNNMLAGCDIHTLILNKDFSMVRDVGSICGSWVHISRVINCTRSVADYIEAYNKCVDCEYNIID